MRTFSRLSLTLLSLGVVASAASFAGFSIKPNGDQKLNLQTGVTVLAQGGSASDAQSGLTVAGKYIEYKDGEFLKAREATLTTRDGGRLTADSADYDARTGELKASGHLVYNDARVKGLTAESGSVQTREGMLVARGNVKSETPLMSADTVIVDYQHNRALMSGNYRYNYGGTSLASSKADARLYVTWDAQGKASATSKPTAAQLAAFQPYLR